MGIIIKILLTLLDCILIVPMLGLIFSAKECWDINDIPYFVLGIVGAIIALVSFVAILVCVWVII